MFTLGNRGNILGADLEGPIIVPHAAQKADTKVSNDTSTCSGIKGNATPIVPAKSHYMCITEIFSIITSKEERTKALFWCATRLIGLWLYPMTVPNDCCTQWVPNDCTQWLYPKYTTGNYTWNINKYRVWDLYNFGLIMLEFVRLVYKCVIQMLKNDTKLTSCMMMLS